MKTAKKHQKHLEKLKAIKRRKHHPLIHRIHKKYRISKRTLFYVKEYGPHTNVPKTIIRESIRILLLASIISSFGGLALEHIKTVFISIMPLVILLPALNGMIGNYGIVVSSRFTTMLHEGKIKRKWWTNRELKRLFFQLFTTSFSIVILCAFLALLISSLSDYRPSAEIAYKIVFISAIDVLLLVGILFLVAVLTGLHFYRKKEDPNNFLIPITTSIADFGNMVLLSVLVIVLF